MTIRLSHMPPLCHPSYVALEEVGREKPRRKWGWRVQEALQFHCQEDFCRHDSMAHAGKHPLHKSTRTFWHNLQRYKSIGANRFIHTPKPGGCKIPQTKAEVQRQESEMCGRMHTFPLETCRMWSVWGSFLAVSFSLTQSVRGESFSSRRMQEPPKLQLHAWDLTR